MKKGLLFLLFLFVAKLKSQDFIKEQLQYPRVNEAYNSKYYKIDSLFKKKKIELNKVQVFWRAFKWNKTLELWAYSIDSQNFIHVFTYPICTTVGELGPKRKEGDLQIPEGVYEIKSFNPASKYYLSLELNYPNESDKILSKAERLGGDIYIHGKCETIGCLPMNDDLIKEIYLISAIAKNNGQLMIPIHIFPTRLTLNNFNKLKLDYFKSNVSLLAFWSNLKQVYDFFEKNKIVPTVSVDPSSGKYVILN
jgi:murein L,D-transpeptidase YafK